MTHTRWSEADHRRDPAGKFAAKAAGAPATGQVERLRVQAEREEGPSRAEIEDALAELDLPEQAVDGDCIPFSGAVISELRRHGIGSQITFVSGWVAPQVLAFLHQAVSVGDYVVDASATQYDARLPAVIIATKEEYATMLGDVTGVPVTVD